MNTAEALKQLESTKNEAEMLALAQKLGVTRAFFNVGDGLEYFPICLTCRRQTYKAPNQKALPLDKKCLNCEGYYKLTYN